MGAHKQRWTAEEESALKAGVLKYGMGKWRTILSDPEFSSILCLRSNVDLKDKWRNINVTANGWGSRRRARLSLKKSPTTSKRKRDDDHTALTTVPDSVEEIVDAKPLQISIGTRKRAASKEPSQRLDSLIMEAIISIKEPGGSDKHAIALFIEELYCAPPNLKKLLSTKLKLMAANGKLIKLERKYRIPPNSTASEVRSSPSGIPSDGKRKKSFKPEENGTSNMVDAPIEIALSNDRSMSALEAAEEAARLVAVAEAAIAEAGEAAREADAAEAAAEAAQFFAEAAMKALKCRTVQTWYVDA